MSELCPLDIDTHSLAVMLRECKVYDKSIAEFLKNNFVCHIGSHDAIEFGIYKHFGCAGAYYFEANKYVFPNLLKRLNNEPGHKAFLATLWSEPDKTLDFHFYRNKTDGAGSLYEPEKFNEYVKDCPMLEETTQVITNTFDNFVTDGIIDISNIIFLNIDTQGAELEIFKGATLLLNSQFLKFIWCEVSWGNIYKNAPLINDITDYLNKFNFLKVGVREDSPNHGDALYIRM